MLPAALALAAPGCTLVALIKPQFEVGRGNLGKGGIVRDAAQHDAVCAKIQAWLSEQIGWTIIGLVPSPIEGPDGNKEFLIAARKP
ncbi:SAM-dependent methyltransferase [Elstera litoralis]|uniref:SAM-dependent methyltransferase n=1 Tax=Elstera litoralis TaxID=552518 RepID=UPI000AE6F1E4